MAGQLHNEVKSEGWKTLHKREEAEVLAAYFAVHPFG